MPAVTTLTDTGGVDWVLDGTDGVWEGVGKKGFHAPTYTHYRDESPAIAGGFWRGARAIPRELLLPVVIRDQNRDNVLARRRALIKAISPLKGECVIKSAWPDGSARSIRCRYVDGMDSGEQGSGEFGITVIMYPLRFVADDPYLYGDELSEYWEFLASSRTELPMPGVDTMYEAVTSPLLVSISPGTTLNANPGFESGTTGWTAVGGVLSQDTSIFQTGTASGKLVPDGVTSNARIATAQVAVVPNSTVVPMASMRCANARTLNLNVNWYTSGAVYISTTSYALPVLANTWTPFQTAMVAPFNAAFASLVPTLSGASVVGDIMHVDDATISQADGASAFNPGDVDSYPTWELTGPFSSITMTNGTTGETYTLVHSAATTTNKLFVVTDPGESYIVDEEGTNRWDVLQGSLWPLISGLNSIDVTIAGAGVGSSASLRFRPLYEGD